MAWQQKVQPLVLAHSVKPGVGHFSLILKEAKSEYAKLQ